MFFKFLLNSLYIDCFFVFLHGWTTKVSKHYLEKSIFYGIIQHTNGEFEIPLVYCVLQTFMRKVHGRENEQTVDIVFACFGCQ